MRARTDEQRQIDVGAVGAVLGCCRPGDRGGCGERCWAGWDALFASVWRRGCRRSHRGVVEGGDVAVIAASSDVPCL